MRTSNHATVVAKDGHAATSSYVIGLFGQGQRQFLFGASVVLRFQGIQDRWKLTHARINVNWCKGVLTLATHWRRPPSDECWQLCDPPPAIVSELDSPWALVGNALPYGDVNDALRELYSRYSWAIDQGDIALLSDCYTDDAGGGFPQWGRANGGTPSLANSKVSDVSGRGYSILPMLCAWNLRPMVCMREFSSQGSSRSVQGMRRETRYTALTTRSTHDAKTMASGGSAGAITDLLVHRC